MDIDFHFSTIYVLSRWAGFNGTDAKIVADSSQFVDDNMSDKPRYVKEAVEPYVLQDGTTCNKRLSGHEMWQNIREKGNYHVWIPFHFLPGLNGETTAEKLVCKKDSTLAKEVLELAITNQNGNRLYKLGMVLHVYADTWAHQEFAGMTDQENEISGISVMEPKVSLLTRIEDDVLEVAGEIRPLGHASAIHWPDRPYVRWTSKQKFVDGRSNWDEFMEASNSIYQALLRCKEQDPVELPLEKRDLLMAAFRDIQHENCDSRNQEWIKRIQNNGFQFDDFSEMDQNINYDKELIKRNIADSFEDNGWKLFYDALDEHYNMVKEKLNSCGISIPK